MERMIIFCMVIFCSSMVLIATPQKAVKYKQLVKTIEHLETVVKNEDTELLHTPENPVDGCLFTAVTCFQRGTLQLQPKNSQVNSTFIKTVKILRRTILRDSGKQCESSCESYGKKAPKDFLKSFAKLMKKVIRVDSSGAEDYGKSTI
ncbi:interleukin-21 [Rhea pennata]|uniref:interleukin-21 n=1 Tax=Rhea pennata TaxID=8795 RepID=UPI002E260E83